MIIVHSSINCDSRILACSVVNILLALFVWRSFTKRRSSNRQSINFVLSETMVAVRPLSPALAEKARIELGETPALLASGIQHLKDWIHSQPHLKARTDDQWLAAFLRGCKFRLDQAKAKIDLYYSLRNMEPEFQKVKYNDPKVFELLDRGTIVTLPTTRNHERLSIMRIGTYDPKEHNAFDVVSTFLFVNQINFLEDDNLTVAGLIHIVDLRNTRLAHYLQLTPRQLRNAVYANQDSLPMRIKEGHVIGAPKIFVAMLNFLKRFLSEKIRNRIHMHHDIDTLYEYIPRDLLPPEYGGTASSIREINERWKAKVAAYNEFYEDDLQYGTDESLRVKGSYKWWGNKSVLKLD